MTQRIESPIKSSAAHTLFWADSRSLPIWAATAHSVVKVEFFVQKFQILEKLKKLSISIFVSKLTIFSGKKIEIFEFFAPKLVKYCHFIVLFGQF